jgi:hypothetical protein
MLLELPDCFPSMTSDRLRQCRDILDWSARALARRAEVSPVTARRWLNGQREISAKVAAAMEAMVAATAALCSGRPQTSQLTACGSRAGKLWLWHGN